MSENCLGEPSLKDTHPDGECSKILVPNPVMDQNQPTTTCKQDLGIPLI